MRRLLLAFGKRRWLPTVIVAAAIYGVSAIPGLDIGSDLFPGCDKVIHFIEYLILGVTLRYWSRESRKIFIAGGLSFGALDELHQLFVPNRVASYWDFAADICGVLVGYLIVGRFGVKKDDG
jgi:VanZ family protein